MLTDQFHRDLYLRLSWLASTMRRVHHDWQQPDLHEGAAMEHMYMRITMILSKNSNEVPVDTDNCWHWQTV